MQRESALWKEMQFCDESGPRLNSGTGKGWEARLVSRWDVSPTVVSMCDRE